MLDDVDERRYNGANISAIKTINGQPAVDFLTSFAARNSFGTVEPHADWNQLMYSPVQDIMEVTDVFSGGATFYPGDELNITFENGTNDINTYWEAIYTVPYFTGPLTTSGDYYNFFVLGLTPASYNEVQLPEVFNLSRVGSSTNRPMKDWSDQTNGAYPDDPVVVQSNLMLGNAGGVVTGYIQDNGTLGVLSIPSFDEAGYDTKSFSWAVNNFTEMASRQNVSRIIIDVSGNQGGQVLLALFTFSAFFPNIEPFAGSRMRSHYLANVVGNATTDYWASAKGFEKTFTESSEWVVTDRINAETGKNFSSWSEFYGPLPENGDYFSRVVRVISCWDGMFLKLTLALRRNNTTSPTESSKCPTLKVGFSQSTRATPRLSTPHR